MTDLLSLLSLYQSELVHTIRTPLAVVSNELQYVELTSDASNVAKAKQRVAEIDAILKGASGCFPQGTEPEVVGLFSLFPEEISRSGSSFDVCVSADLLGRALMSVVQHFDVGQVSIGGLPEERILCVVAGHGGGFTPRSSSCFHELKDVFSTRSRLEMIAFDIFFFASDIEFQADISSTECKLTYRFAP